MLATDPGWLGPPYRGYEGGQTRCIVVYAHPDVLTKVPPDLAREFPQKNLKSSVSLRAILATISPPMEAYQYSEVLAAFLLGPLHASDQLHTWIRRD